VVCHDSGALAWCGQGKTSATLDRFSCGLGPERARQLEAIWTDMAVWWQTPIARQAPQAAVFIDPFHVVAMAGRALEELRRRGVAAHARD